MTTFKKVDYTLQVLKDEIDQGILGLPDIQRPFVWPNKKVRDLFDSLFRGYPVGYLLFWDNDQSANTRTIGTSNTKQRAPQRLIVDGQQRLTALYAVLTGSTVLDESWQEREIDIAFRPVDATFEVADAAIRRSSEYITNISELWTSGKPYRQFVQDFITRLKESRDVTTDEENAIWDNIDRLRDLTRYSFVALEISSEVDEQAVSDIFVRINSQGKRLNESDFILTLMSVFWEDGRRALETFSRTCKAGEFASDSPKNDFIEPGPDQLLRVVVALAFRRARLRYVYLLLRGRDLDTGEESPAIRDRQFQHLSVAQAEALDTQNWKDFLQCLVRAGYRNSSMINSKTGLLYSYALFLIGRIDFGVETAVLQRLISRWFFVQALTGRYTGSPESAMESDLLRLRNVDQQPEVFVQTVEAMIAEAVPDDYWRVTLPGQLESSASSSPGISAYNASLVLHHANVLFAPDLPVADLLSGKYDASRKAVEKHHLFPKAYLKSIGLGDIATTNQIANMAYIPWEVNMEISDTNPAEYWQGILTKYPVLAADMHLHALPDNWHTMSYKDFVAARRKNIAAVIWDGYRRL